MDTTPSYDDETRLTLCLTLFEDCLVVREDETSLAEYLTGLKVDLSEPEE